MRPGFLMELVSLDHDGKLGWRLACARRFRLAHKRRDRRQGPGAQVSVDGSGQFFLLWAWKEMVPI